MGGCDQCGVALVVVGWFLWGCGGVGAGEVCLYLFVVGGGHGGRVCGFIWVCKGGLQLVYAVQLSDREAVEHVSLFGFGRGRVNGEQVVHVCGDDVASWGAVEQSL